MAHLKSINNIRYNLNLLILQKENFILYNSNYTTKFDLLNGTVMSFISEEMSNQVFYIFNLIKKQINLLPENKKNELIELSKSLPNSQYIGLGFNPPIMKGKCINIDLTSAYPKTAMLQGLITEEFYNSIEKYNKIHKLKAFGMLGSNKIKISYKEGIPIYSEHIKSEYYHFFFLLVKLVDRYILECSLMAQSYYLFYWVDGIYLKENTPPEIIEEIETFLLSLGYEIKKNLIDLEIIEKGEYFNLIADGKSFNIQKDQRNKFVNDFIKSIVMEE